MSDASEKALWILTVLSRSPYITPNPGQESLERIEEEFSFSRFYAPSFTQLAKHSINDITPKKSMTCQSLAQNVPIPDRGQITTW